MSCIKISQRWARFLLGSGLLSSSNEIGSPLRLQFPFTGPLQNELITLSACVFWQNCSTFGLSWAPPLCHWQPKIFSRGSWQMCSLRKTFTPDTLNSCGIISTNESTVIRNYVRIISSTLASYTCDSQTQQGFSAEKHLFLLQFCESIPLFHTLLPVIEELQEGFLQPLKQ